MTARVTVNVAESKNVLTVPLSAVKEESGQKYVTVMAGGKEQKKAVKTGLSDDEKTEVVSGLSRGRPGRPAGRQAPHHDHQQGPGAAAAHLNRRPGGRA